MNKAHLHLLVNHFPIIGTFFGIGILIVALFLKNNSIKNTAYWVFITTAIFAAISMATGDGAEHIVKDFPDIGRKIIHVHEEYAEKLALVLYLLGIISIVGFYMNRINHVKATLLSYIILVVGIVALGLTINVGASGGEIRHTEIRSNFIPNQQIDLSKTIIDTKK